MAEPVQQAGTYVTYVRLEDVRPAVRNPKEHDVEGIARLIRRFGFIGTLTTDERTQRLVAGHGRIAALAVMYAAGDTCPKGILVDDDGGWLVPMARGWASTTDAEAEAVIIADNHAQNWAGWHHKTLAEMVEDVTAADGQMFEDLQLGADLMESLFSFAKDGSDPDPTDFTDLTGDPDTDDVIGSTDLEDTPEAPVFIECPNCRHTFTPKIGA